MSAVVGRQVVGWEQPATGGHTPALRLVATFDDDATAFVKVGASDLTDRWLRAELPFYERVTAPFVPRFLGGDGGDEPFVVLEDLRAAHWPPPWRPGDVERVLAALDELAATSVPGLGPLADLGAELVGWCRVADDPVGFLGLGLCSPAWLEAALPVLVAAEAGATLDGDSLCHGDVRSDNLCLADDGRVVFVDWNNACTGHRQFDRHSFLPSLAVEGGPQPDAVIADADADPGFVALLSGYWAWRAWQPEPALAHGVRDRQLVQLRVALPWAARVLGLPPP